MTADEKEIIDYLKGWPGMFVSGKEIARKVRGRNYYDENRGWAIPILAKMVQDGLLDTDQLGCFRLKQQDKRKQKHVSPQFLRILKSSGQAFDTIEIDDNLGETLVYVKAPAELTTAPAPSNNPAPTMPQEENSGSDRK